MLRYAVKLSCEVCDTPSSTYVVSPAAIAFFAFTIVFHGEAKLPVLASLPVVATKNILPARTVKGRPLLAPTPGTKRELLVWIWYPAAGRQSLVTDDYLPARLRLKPKDAGGGNIWTLLTRDASKIRGHSAADPGVSPEERAYPVVIMRAGGSAGVLNYSTLAEDLASHGYVVVGFDVPYRTSLVVFPDGQQHWVPMQVVAPA